MGLCQFNWYLDHFWTETEEEWMEGVEAEEGMKGEEGGET